MLDSDKLKKVAINRLLLFYLEDVILKNLWFVLLASLLTACSSSDNFVANAFRAENAQFTDAKNLTSQLRSPQVTSVTINSLPLQQLSLESSNRINITADSPIVNFPEGNSFVAALLVPKDLNKFTFVLESVVGRTVFVPHVIFLNESLVEVSRIDDFEYKTAGFLLIQKEMDAELTADIRYILIYSQDSDLDGRTEIFDAAREYELNKGNAVSDISFPRRYAKHSPIGKLNIRLKDVFFSAPVLIAGENPTKNKANKMTIKTIDAAPSILSDTENFYLQLISKAIKENNLSRAVMLVEEAERAGSKKAKIYYQQELDKR